jgi:hypothetical protein
MRSLTTAAGAKSRWPLALVGAGILMLVLPSRALAHGPVAPVASSYLARVTTTPGGLEAKVIDGDQRLWLRAHASGAVVVLDYRGTPYLRFARAGVYVNRNSSMYYLNQTPPEVPPSNLTSVAPASWHRVAGREEYSWHDGRLHALATVALSPGARYVGRWSIPTVVDGRVTAISGSLWHAPDPSLVWFWPIVVLFACVLAARRLRRPWLDDTISRMLALVALIAVAVAAAGRELHGRPTVSVGQLIVLAIAVGFVAFGLGRVLAGRAGGVLYFVISLVALIVGGALVPALDHGFVLLAIPSFVARVAAVLCLGCGAGLFAMVLARIERPEPRR